MPEVRGGQRVCAWLEGRRKRESHIWEDVAFVQAKGGVVNIASGYTFMIGKVVSRFPGETTRTLLIKVKHSGRIPGVPTTGFAPVCFCFDYCCVPFVVDLNVLDISFHCILQSILPLSGGYRGDITPKRITDTDRQYSA